MMQQVSLFNLQNVCNEIACLTNISRYIKSEPNENETMTTYINKITKSLEGLSSVIEKLSEVMLLIKSGNPLTKEQQDDVNKFAKDVNDMTASVRKDLQQLMNTSSSINTFSVSLSNLIGYSHSPVIGAAPVGMFQAFGNQTRGVGPLNPQVFRSETY